MSGPIETFNGNLAVPIDGRIGFGLPEIGSNRPTGPVLLASIGDPNGVLTAPVSTLALQADTAALWQNTDGGTTWSALSAGQGNVLVSLSDGTWTKPEGITTVRVWMIGGGNGGASGSKQAGGIASVAGNGGGASGLFVHTFNADELGATVAITVGQGGTGGASVTANSTGGNPGGNGTNSSFGSASTYTDPGDERFNGLSFVGGDRFNSGGGSFASSGAGTSAPDLAGYIDYSGGSTGPTGGGAGGGITSGDVANAGGDGGSLFAGIYDPLGVQADAVGPVGGAVDNDGATQSVNWPPANSYLPGLGGGGGGASTTGDAGNGGAGGFPGGGSGGGGAARDGVGNSGAGGNGGNGVVVITCW